MEQDWKQAFYYTKSERNGLILLLLLCVLLFLLPQFFFTQKKEPSPNFSEFQKEVDLFLLPENTENNEQKIITKEAKLFSFDPNRATKDQLTELGISQKIVQTIINFRSKGGQFFKKEDLKKIYGLSSEEYQRLNPFIKISDIPSDKKATTKTENEPATNEKIKLHPFDPNTSSKKELIGLGISPKAANILINFRNKGGQFRKKEDLKKVFGISQSDFQRLEAYIIIPETQKTKDSATNEKPQTFPTKKQENVFVDINQSTAEDWQQLRGIGPAFSKRIINWRDKLGGFNDIQQVSETYGLPDSTFQSIAPQLKISPINKTLNINQVSVEELKNHPYLNYRQANAIINYRNNHGSFKSFDDLKPIKALSEKTLNSVKPYFSYK